VSKKRSNLVGREILKGVLWSGLFIVACGSPSFVPKIIPQISRLISYKIGKRRKSTAGRKKVYNAFEHLRRRGLIKAEWRNKQAYVFLTAKGKILAGKYQINDLRIEKPRKWDRLWRILIFDIKEKQKAKREALRGKLKQMGLYQLQKSVWVCPYNFFGEIKLLREFFGLNNGEMKIITAYEIENDKIIKKHFGLR